MSIRTALVGAAIAVVALSVSAPGSSSGAIARPPSHASGDRQVDPPTPGQWVPPWPSPGVTPWDRVLAIGDSLMDQSSGPLAVRLATAGAAYRIDAVGGSGFGGDLYDTVDWVSRARADVAAFKPTKVVVEFCCNWWPPYPTSSTGGPIAGGSPQFRAYWESRARELARVVTAGGAALWWVVTPPSASPLFDASLVDPINDTTFAQVVSPGTGPKPRLVRWDMALTAGTGRYTGSLEVRGVATAVRGPDGLHLTPEGADIAAAATFGALGGAAAAPTPWGPFRSGSDVTRFAMERVFGAEPYDLAAYAPLAEPRRAGLESWQQHLVRLAGSRRWALTAAPVARLYLAALGRLPDADGLAFWTRAVTRGVLTPDGVAGMLLRSPESAARYGGSTTDDQFVARLYRNVLDREPDDAGASYWGSRLGAGDTRSSVLRRFAESAENRRASMAGVYAVVAQTGLTGAISGPLPERGAPSPTFAEVAADVLRTPAFSAVAGAYVPRSPG